MHLAPSQLVIVHQTEIQLIRASGIIKFRGAMLLEESDFVVDAHSGNERDDETSYEELHRL